MIVQLLESSCLLTATAMDPNLKCRHSHVSLLLSQGPKSLWDSAAEKYKMSILHFHVKVNANLKLYCKFITLLSS